MALGAHQAVLGGYIILALHAGIIASYAWKTIWATWDQVWGGKQPASCNVVPAPFIPF